MILKKSDLSRALAALSASRQLYVPAEMTGGKRFVLWHQGLEPALDGGNSKLPPKDLLFPHSEAIYSYDLGGAPSVTPAAEQAAEKCIFGIRPCDVRSIECLDKAFLENDVRDDLYARRRHALSLVALACSDPGENCFCDSMGGSPVSAPAADVIMHDLGEVYGLKAQSPRGEALLAELEGIVSDGSFSPVPVSCPTAFPMSEGISSALMEKFNDMDFWASLSSGCLGCGVCTYVCPSCYCFDMGVDARGRQGTQFRCWDSCMFSDYTRTAGGHDPRPSKRERLRNRFLHKLAYFRQRNGMQLCVGCGRCVGSCPGHIDITEVIEKAGEVDNK